MEITRTTSFRINLGNYEHMEIGGEVTVRDTDMESGTDNADDQVADMIEFATKTLDKMLQPDLESAAHLTTNKDSFVHEDPAPPARTQPARPTRRN